MKNSFKNLESKREKNRQTDTWIGRVEREGEGERVTETKVGREG